MSPDRHGMPTEEELYALQNMSNGHYSGGLSNNATVTHVSLDLVTPGKVSKAVTISKVKDVRKTRLSG